MNEHSTVISIYIKAYRAAPLNIQDFFKSFNCFQ
jgi:hypothetical protein